MTSAFDRLTDRCHTERLNLTIVHDPYKGSWERWRIWVLSRIDGLAVNIESFGATHYEAAEKALTAVDNALEGART